MIMRIGLKPGVMQKRLEALRKHFMFPTVFMWQSWAMTTRPTLHINETGWTIRAGELSLTCEHGEVVGDPWLYFWLTGDVSRMIQPAETDLDALVDEFEAQPLEALR